MNKGRNEIIGRIQLAKNERRSEPSSIEGTTIMYRLDRGPIVLCLATRALDAVAARQKTHLPRRHRDKLAEPF